MAGFSTIPETVYKRLSKVQQIVLFRSQTKF